MALERKSSIRKAPPADVVDVLTSRTDSVPDDTEAQAAAAKLSVSQATSTRGPGPGRPRSKRRMEPFSSKIEIELRDELDAYIQATGITIIDFIDEAIRERLRR